MKNIVTIGGGGGHAQVLKGLKLLPGITITGICPSTDSGGSTRNLIPGLRLPGISRRPYEMHRGVVP